MYNNIDTQADLRTLYQAYSSQIEYSKNQLWTVVYYGILAIGGIVALSKGFITVMNGFETWMIIFPPMIIIILFTCLYNMLKCWRSIVEGRAKFVEIRDMLSLTFRQMLMTRPGSGHSDNYTH